MASAAFWSVITSMPACRSPPVISVMRPSLMPGVTATATGRAVRSTHTCLAPAVLAPAAADLRVAARHARHQAGRDALLGAALGRPWA
jgi:hypothetical protein